MNTIRKTLGLSDRIKKIRTNPQAAQKPQAGKPGTPPIADHEKVTCLCGHEVDFPLFEDRKDKFRDARRKKLADHHCQSCRLKAHEEKIAAEQAAAVERRKVKAAKKLEARKSLARLPDESRFDLCYDAEKIKWQGTLAIHKLADWTILNKAKVFQGEASGVFGLLEELDSQYRKWLEAAVDSK